MECEKYFYKYTKGNILILMEMVGPDVEDHGPRSLLELQHQHFCFLSQELI